MLAHRSDPIPQAFQQHGGVPKHAAVGAPSKVPPVEAALAVLAVLEQPGPFVTAAIGEPVVAKAA